MNIKAFLICLIVIPLFAMALVSPAPPALWAQGGGDLPCDENTDVDCIDWDAGIAFALGLGAPAQWAKSEAQKNISAQRAAKVDAARNLLELIKGVSITGETTMQQAMLLDDKVISRVQGKLASLRLVGQPKYFSDGSISLTMTANLREVVPVELYISGPPQQLRPPNDARAAAVKINTQRMYTGLIIDAKGTGVLPAMSPKVLDPEGREVYGSAYVSREYAVSQGIVGYAKDIEAATTNDRVKGNPLLIKALEAKGANMADLVIDQADADALRQIAQGQNFMRESRVLIVLD
ncbi:MAG: hypothetical protein IID61_00565 [SAR324 cluster bacterium]|nr:hypothetical protein [SAR324 cluster bacterium]